MRQRLLSFIISARFFGFEQSYEHITGEKFDKAAETGDIAARIERNVAEWLAAYKK